MLCTDTDVLGNKNIYKWAGNCDDQQYYKLILESTMVSSPEVFNVSSPMPYGPSVLVKQLIVRKSLRQFSETLDVKPKTAIHGIYDSKSDRESIRAGSMLFPSIPKILGHKKINECVKISLHNFILKHPYVVHYPIANDCLKLSIYVQAEI